MPRCRCNSGKMVKRCCGPLHAGEPASSAEALMRSRYAAYASGLVDYILDTTAPGPQFVEDRDIWRDQVRSFCRHTVFLRLQVTEHVEEADRAFVTFYATLEQAGRDVSIGERSRFVRVDGRWCYHSGTPAPPLS